MVKIAQLHGVARAGSTVTKVLAFDPEEPDVFAASFSRRN